MKKTILTAVLAAFILGGCDGKEQTAQTKTAQENKGEEATKQSTPQPKQQKSEATTQTPEQPPAPKTQPAQTATAEKTGKDLYMACIPCHGVNAEKHAFNASDIIANWDAKRIEEALMGYKKGIYGGAMKSTMTGQVANLSEEDMKKLAEYISGLNPKG